MKVILICFPNPIPFYNMKSIRITQILFHIRITQIFVNLSVIFVVIIHESYINVGIIGSYDILFHRYHNYDTYLFLYIMHVF